MCRSPVADLMRSRSRSFECKLGQFRGHMSAKCARTYHLLLLTYTGRRTYKEHIQYIHTVAIYSLGISRWTALHFTWSKPTLTFNSFSGCTRRLFWSGVRSQCTATKCYLFILFIIYFLFSLFICIANWSSLLLTYLLNVSYRHVCYRPLWHDNRIQINSSIT